MSPGSRGGGASPDHWPALRDEGAGVGVRRARSWPTGCDTGWVRGTEQGNHPGEEGAPGPGRTGQGSDTQGLWGQRPPLKCHRTRGSTDRSHLVSRPNQTPPEAAERGGARSGTAWALSPPRGQSGWRRRRGNLGNPAGRVQAEQVPGGSGGRISGTPPTHPLPPNAPALGPRPGKQAEAFSGTGRVGEGALPLL